MSRLRRHWLQQLSCTSWSHKSVCRRPRRVMSRSADRHADMVVERKRLKKTRRACQAQRVRAMALRNSAGEELFIVAETRRILVPPSPVVAVAVGSPVNIGHDHRVRRSQRPLRRCLCQRRDRHQSTRHSFILLSPIQLSSLAPFITPVGSQIGCRKP